MKDSAVDVLSYSNVVRDITQRDVKRQFWFFAKKKSTLRAQTLSERSVEIRVAYGFLTYRRLCVFNTAPNSCLKITDAALVWRISLVVAVLAPCCRNVCVWGHRCLYKEAFQPSSALHAGHHVCPLSAAKCTCNIWRFADVIPTVMRWCCCLLVHFALGRRDGDWTILLLF